MFQELMEKHQHLNENDLEVLNIYQACKKYDVKAPRMGWADLIPLPSFVRSKVQVINDLCLKIQEKGRVPQVQHLAGI